MGLRGAVLEVLEASIVGEEILISPSLVSQPLPPIIIPRMSADVHHRVDRARAAEGLAPGPVNLPAVEARLGRRGVAPIKLGNSLVPLPWRVDRFVVVWVARFEQQHVGPLVFAESVGKYTPRGAGTDDHVIMHVILCHIIAISCWHVYLPLGSSAVGG